MYNKRLSGVGVRAGIRSPSNGKARGGGGEREAPAPLTPHEKSHGYCSIYVPFLNALPNIGKKSKKSSLSYYIKTALTPKNKKRKSFITT